MKSIELTILADKKSGLGESYKDLALISVGMVDPKEPLNFITMGKRLELVKKINDVKHGGVLEFEDAEFELFSDLVLNKTPWLQVDADIYSFMIAVDKVRKS